MIYETFVGSIPTRGTIINHCDRGGMVYATDLKSVGYKALRVRVPPVTQFLKKENSLKEKKSKMKEVYVAITEYYWGVGETPTAAKKQARLVGGLSHRESKGKFLVKKMPPGSIDVYVDHMGGIVWKWDEGADKDCNPTIVETPIKKGKEK